MAAAAPTGALASWLAPFAPLLTRPTWRRGLVLVTGAVLAPHRRTIGAIPRAAGQERQDGSARHHAVLGRGRWPALAAARVPLAPPARAFVPAGPVVISPDDTLERRRGAEIEARGIHRDPVRSSHGRFVKPGGPRRPSAMPLAPVPWAGRARAPPFPTVLAPPERHAAERGVRREGLTDRARQALPQAARRLPGRRIIAVTDSGHAASGLLDAVRGRVRVVTRLRLDARLFTPPPPRARHTIGRPRPTGHRLPTLAHRLADPSTPWRRVAVPGWHGGRERIVEVAPDTAPWHHPGMPVVPLRWVPVRDPEGAFRPRALLRTDLAAGPADILGWFVRRWAVEVTFAEARRHLGTETRRQWSDKAVARATSALLGPCSLVAPRAGELHRSRVLVARAASWYRKERVTSGDAPAAVRRSL